MSTSNLSSSNLGSKDLTNKFFSDLKNIAFKLGAKPMDMLSVMMAESGVRANAHNPNGHASGLIQFMPNTLSNLGWRKGHEAFRLLSAEQQLPFVEAYYKPYGGNLDSVAGLYVATFLPALISHHKEKDYVLTAKGGQLGWAYAPNASFDENKDAKITVGELEKAVIRNCRGFRWESIRARCTGEGIQPAPFVSDLKTIYGIQSALANLGYYPKDEVDGIVGPKTRQAVIDFQTKSDLVPDGIVGPKTIAELQKQARAFTVKPGDGE